MATQNTAPHTQPENAQSAALEDLDEAGWRRLRHDYEHGNEPVEALLEHYKISRGRLYRRMAHEGWIQRRSAADPRSPHHDKPILVAPLEKRAELAARLFHVLEEHILAIEKESLSHDASHIERDARALTAMARALDQLSEMLEQADQTVQKPAGGAAAKPDEEIDADAFRQLLAERLDRLGQVGDEPAPSAQPE